MRSVRRAAVLAGLAAALAAAAPAAVSVRPAPGAPDPKLMVLVAADIGGATVANQGYYKDDLFPSVISYSREFEDGRFAGVDLIGVESEAEIGTSVASTSRFVSEVRQAARTREFREVIREAFAEEISGDLEGTVTILAIGRPRTLGVGDDGFDLVMSFRILGLRTDSHMTVFRVERALGLLFTMGYPGQRVSFSLVRRLATLMADRMKAELTPVATRVPVISGSAQEGQALTASKGTWLHRPTRFAYQWQRCDVAGEACVAIPGATAPTYVLTTADAGSTIRVAVTARNAVGSATAVSAQTAAVAPVTPPTNTVPPTISGTAQQGQTLTASTGTWTGAPTTFSYQWQRCDAAGTTCADVASAPSIYYPVSAGDAGFRIRVGVTATNAVGSATAHSMATAVVP